MSSYDWVLVDGKNLAMRIFHTHKDLKTSGSTVYHTGLAHGFMRNLILLRRRYEGRVVVCWDKGNSRRMKLFPGYKASRHAKPWEDRELYESHYSVLREVMKLVGVRQVAKKGCEADDLIYTLALRLEGTKLIASNDHDFYQLLRLEGVHLYRAKKKGDEIWDAARLEAEWGCTPDEYLDAMALAGDSTDDIPGLKRVGMKTAIKMVRGERDKPEGWREVEKRNRSLVRMYDEHPLTFSRFVFDGAALEEALERYQLERLLDNLHWLERLGT